MIKKILLITTLSFITTYLFSQVLYDEFKAALIFQFAKNISWQNEDDLSSYNFGIYGQDSAVFNALKSIVSNTKLKKKKIIVTKINNFESFKDIQLLFIDKKDSLDIIPITKAIENKNILLVTEACSDKKNIMLNITFNEKSEMFSFEINKANIIIEDLIIEPELLLLGGTEIDVRELYREMKQNLEKEKQTVQNQQKAINKQLENISKHRQKIDSLLIFINSLNNQISTLSTRLENLNDKISQQQKILTLKSNQLRNQVNLLENRENQLKLQTSKIEKQEKSINNQINKLDELNSEIDKNRDIISEQKTTLSTKETLLNTKNRLLYISIAFVVALLALAILVLRAFSVKRKANFVLEDKVNERTKELTQEIEQHKKTEFALVKSKERFRQTFDLAPIGIAETFQDKFLKVNKQFCKIFSYTEDELLNQSFKKLTHPDNIKVSNEIIESLYNNPGQIQSIEKKYIRKDGKEIWANAKLISVADDKGEIKHIIVAIKDDTEKKIIELELELHRNHLEHLVKTRTEELSSANQELKSINDELFLTNENIRSQKEEIKQTLKKLHEAQSQLIQSEKMASLGVLTAGVAHEINNPVNFITGGVYGLDEIANCIFKINNLYNEITHENFETQIKIINKEKEKTDFDFRMESLKEIPETIKIGADRIASIVKSLQTFTRKDQDYIELSDIHENIDATLTMLHNQTKNKIEIIKNFGDVPKINCYPGKLNQVFMNILINAIHSIPEKGTITISTNTKQKPKKILLISIKDTGEGIPDNIKGNIFEAFFTTKDVGKGSGMGLYITHDIIKLHNGEIVVNSKEGKGTEFIIKIPYDSQK